MLREEKNISKILVNSRRIWMYKTSSITQELIYSYPVRPDASINSAVNAALSSHGFGSSPVRPDASINSAVNAALSSHGFGSSPVRPELVEGLIERSLID